MLPLHTTLPVFLVDTRPQTHQHRTTISPPITRLMHTRYRTTFIIACDARSSLNKFSANLEATSQFYAPRRPGARDLAHLRYTIIKVYMAQLQTHKQPSANRTAVNTSFPIFRQQNGPRTATGQYYWVIRNVLSSAIFQASAARYRSLRSSCNSVPTFRGNPSVPSSRVNKSKMKLLVIP